MKGKCYAFSSNKQRNKVSLVYFERKMQQETYGSRYFKLKYEKTKERSYLQKSKQEIR